MNPSSPRDGALPAPETLGLPFAAVVLLLFVSSALRMPATFLDPAFWAEDCTVFFHDSVEVGSAAILAPLYGSHHLLPRLIVHLASFFPTFWGPVLYSVAAGVLSSVSLGLFSRAGFRWLVPDDRLRLLLCWLFSLCPGTTESFFALCTVNYALFCGLLFLLLERDAEGRWQMGIRRALLMSFLWISVGQAVVLAAPLAYLYWLTRKGSYLLCLGTLAAAVLLNATSANEFRPQTLPGFGSLALIYIENLAARLAFIPVVPHRYIDIVRRMGSAPFLVLAASLLGGYVWAVFKARRLDRQGARVLAIAALSAMALFPLTVLARDYGLPVLSRWQVYLGGRAALVPSVLALVLLWLWLARPVRGALPRAAAAGLLALTTYCVLFEPFYVPPGRLRQSVWEWPVQAVIIDTALRARREGTLREAVVLGDIRCRPHDPFWKVKKLTIAPRGGSPSAPPPPLR